MSDGAGHTIPGESAVVLLQMGGPRSVEEIEPFLRNLLSDPNMIKLPSWLRPVQPAFGAMTAMVRARSVKPKYVSIGGGSPLVPITLSLMEKLQAELQSDGIPATVTSAMRFCSPTASDAVRSLEQISPNNVLLLPLYPHYSPTTAGSSVDDFLRSSEGAKWETTVAKEWGQNPAYLSLLARWVRSTLEKEAIEDDEPWHLLFTAHGIPERYVRDGDGYPAKIRDAAEEVARRVKGCDGWSLSFQSRVGPLKWTGPYTEELLASLAEKGVKSLVVVPMGFVSDHLETLYDIDILYKRLARTAGIRRFLRVPTFNDHLDFTRLLADIVAEEMGVDTVGS